MSDQDLSGTSSEFQEAVVNSRKLKAVPDNDALLTLYGLFKQVTVGDNTTTRPGTFDFKGKAKWDKWTEYKGKSKSDAEKEYVAKIQELINSIGLQ